MTSMPVGTDRDLRPLFEPRSVAVVGASNDPAKWGQWLARGAIQGEHRRSVFLVNRSGGEVLGRQAFRSLDELPERPELVVLAVPASSFEETVDASLAAGARAIVAIAAGLGETSEEGRRREQAVVGRVREAGAVLLGPNCLGVYDAAAELDLSSSDFVPGPIGVVSQSGNLAIELSLLASEVGLGISRFASLGNQADLEAAELVTELAEHDETRLIAVYSRTSGMAAPSREPRRGRGSRCFCSLAARALRASGRRSPIREPWSATRQRWTRRPGRRGSSG